MFDTIPIPSTELITNIKVQETGFDFDGVIADTAEAFIRLACTQYGHCSFTQEDITNFELENCLNIPFTQVEKIFTDILTDSLAAQLRPIPGAIECLEDFSRSSTVTIITARPVENPVFDWLDCFLSQEARKNIQVVATGNHDDKIRYIHQHQLKFFIDDRAETCKRLVLEQINPLVFTQPWNKNRHSLQTVADWVEIRNLVTGF